MTPFQLNLRVAAPPLRRGTPVALVNDTRPSTRLAESGPQKGSEGASMQSEAQSLDHPRYTGVVCRRCAAPVATPVNEQIMECPACGHVWTAGPPIDLKAA